MPRFTSFLDGVPGGGTKADQRSPRGRTRVGGDPRMGDVEILPDIRREVAEEWLDLRQRLLESVKVEPPEEAATFDFQGNWGEFARGDDRIPGLDPFDPRPQVLINDEAFIAAGVSPAYRDKMILMEALHGLKDVDPVRYNRMEEKALNDPEYREWAMEAAAREGVTSEHFAEWHRRSRFDQVIGGFLFAGDQDIPTMRGWRREDLPWGKPLRQELEQLAHDLDLE